MTPVRAESVISCAKDQAVWPWQAEPYRLWSLLYMIRHYAGNWFAVTENLERLRWTHLMAPAELPANQGRVFTQLEDAAKDLPFSRSLRQQFSRLKQKATDATSEAEHRVVVTILDEFSANLQTELETSLFLCVPETYRVYFEDGLDVFGRTVIDVFPGSRHDVINACRCFALDQSTACVFHLMRVLEHGLQAMAGRFNVPFAVDSWHKVIKGIEDGLTDLRKQPGLTEQDRKDITYYSEAASQFRHIKDAWRNHVSHGREYYDASDADTVFKHVRELMQHLAAPL